MKWIVAAVIIVAGAIVLRHVLSPGPNVVIQPSLSPSPSADTIPLEKASTRTTKKPFGIFVSPAHSPVTPEKFTGYHTGLDFETTPEEQLLEIDVRAICDGQVAVKKYASGYGGVLVQRCTFNGQDVTVIYGHLNLASIQVAVSAVLHRGDVIGALGKGYSTETDGERKHLHLGIHKGAAVDIRGYVPRASDLMLWINPATVL